MKHRVKGPAAAAAGRCRTGKFGEAGGRSPGFVAAFSNRWVVTALLSACLSLLLPIVAVAGGYSMTHEDIGGVDQARLRIGLIKPDIGIFQLSAGGVQERMETWCESGCGNVVSHLEERFGDRLVVIDPDDLEQDLKEEVLDIRGLYQVITYNIAGTWYGALPMPKKYRIFEFSVGPVEEILGQLGVDVLLFVEGRDTIRTGGRKAFEALAFFGAGVVYVTPSYLDAGLVGDSGTLLWYRLTRKVSKADLREMEGAGAYIAAAFEKCPLQ